MRSAIIVLITILCMGCNGKETSGDSGTVFSENFIQSYIKGKSISVPVARPDESGCYYGEFHGDIINKTDKRFKYYSELYNDLSYNGYLVPSENLFLADTIKDINFVSDTRFNENYPEGSNINDITVVNFSSVKDYIYSGYTQIPENSDLSTVCPRKEYSLSTYNLNELPSNPFVLLYERFSFHFTEEPSEDEVKITMVFTTIEDRIIKSSLLLKTK